MSTIKNRIKKILKGILYRKKKRSFAPNKLDKRLEPFINKKHGFFIEAGANNGLMASNTLYFEKYKGWKGLLIEAIPSLADECRKNRKKCIVESCALVSDDYSKEEIEITYCNSYSVVSGGMLGEEWKNNHIQSGKQFLQPGEQTYVVSVTAQTLTQVLDKHQIGHIDLLSLDVEGYEPEVLKGLDFNKYLPDFILIEVRTGVDIDSLISPFYERVEALNITSAYSDVLYRSKKQFLPEKDFLHPKI